MGFLKKIARKILDDEIENYKPLTEGFQKRNIELRGEMEEKETEYREKIRLLEKENLEKNLEKSKADERIVELEKENEILKKYYDLGKEPSDEIKKKIHIDLEINRLKEENLKLIAMRSQVTYISQPYPFYGFGRGF